MVFVMIFVPATDPAGTWRLARRHQEARGWLEEAVMRASDVLPYRLADLGSGKEEPSLRQAREYVSTLQAEAATTTTVPVTTTVPPPTTTTARP